MKILSLGEKVKAKRKEMNMTLKDLAGERITPGQISLIESGKSKPSMDLLEYLAYALNTSVEYLMESEETQAERVCTFFENMAEACILNKEFDNSQKYVEKGILYAEKYKLENKKAKLLFLLGTISMEICQYDVAQQHFLAANILFIKNNCCEDIINTFIKLGKIALKQKAYPSALSYFGQAEKVFIDNRLANEFLLADIFHYMSRTYSKLEDRENANKYAINALDIFKTIRNEKNYARSLLQLSKEYSLKGDTGRAIMYSEKALKAFKAIKENSIVAEFEVNMGKLFSEFDNLEDSFYFLEMAEEIRKKDKESSLVEVLAVLCENYIKLKDVENSKKVLQQIIDNSGHENDKALINYYLLKYKIHILEGDLKEAESTLLMALNFVTNLDFKKEKSEILILIGKFYMDMGQDKIASGYLNNAVKALKDCGVLKNVE